MRRKNIEMDGTDNKRERGLDGFKKEVDRFIDDWATNGV